MVAIPALIPAPAWRFGLLVFVAASSGAWDARRASAVHEALTRHVERVLAPEIRPDFVEVWPTGPRRADDGTVDNAWVTAEHWAAGLSERAKHELFRQMVFFIPAAAASRA